MSDAPGELTYEDLLRMFNTVLMGKPDVEIDKDGRRVFVWSIGPERSSGRVTVDAEARPAPPMLPDTVDDA